MGVITDMLRLILMWKKLKKKKSKTKSYIVYSEDTCRVDRDGGPYKVMIEEDEAKK